MRCLMSTNKTTLENIVYQINLICGWPDASTKTATEVFWSDKVQHFWCCVDDERIISAINSINLNGLIIVEKNNADFENYPNKLR